MMRRSKTTATKPKCILGIESTAHTFGVGIATVDGKILANVRKPFTTKHGGIHPTKAAEHHVDHAVPAVEEALQVAKISWNDIVAIAYSAAPGLGPSLQIGYFLARFLAAKWNKSLIEAHHSVAHLEIGRLFSGFEDPLLLYVSGANTQIIAYDGGKYRVMGETLDTGVGNFLDKLAREMDLGFPGGPQIAALAAKGKQYHELPYSIKGMDVSLGGILTFCKQQLERKKISPEDLAFSVQETVFAMLVEATERALAQSGKSELVLGGGVACNTRLQEMCQLMCQERSVRCHVPANEYLIDNGAMIAWLGVLMYRAGATVSVEQAQIRPYERTDGVSAVWR